MYAARTGVFIDHCLISFKFQNCHKTHNTDTHTFVNCSPIGVNRSKFSQNIHSVPVVRLECWVNSVESVYSTLAFRVTLIKPAWWVGVAGQDLFSTYRRKQHTCEGRRHHITTIEREWIRWQIPFMVRRFNQNADKGKHDIVQLLKYCTPSDSLSPRKAHHFDKPFIHHDHESFNMRAPSAVRYCQLRKITCFRVSFAFCYNNARLPKLTLLRDSGVVEQQQMAGAGRAYSRV